MLGLKLTETTSLFAKKEECNKVKQKRNGEDRKTKMCYSDSSKKKGDKKTEHKVRYRWKIEDETIIK